MDDAPVQLQQPAGAARLGVESGGEGVRPRWRTNPSSRCSRTCGQRSSPTTGCSTWCLTGTRPRSGGLRVRVPVPGTGAAADDHDRRHGPDISALNERALNEQRCRGHGAILRAVSNEPDAHAAGDAGAGVGALAWFTLAAHSRRSTGRACWRGRSCASSRRPCCERRKKSASRSRASCTTRWGRSCRRCWWRQGIRIVATAAA